MFSNHSLLITNISNLYVAKRNNSHDRWITLHMSDEKCEQLDVKYLTKRKLFSMSWKTKLKSSLFFKIQKKKIACTVKYTNEWWKQTNTWPDLHVAFFLWLPRLLQTGNFVRICNLHRKSLTTHQRGNPTQTNSKIIS